MIFVTVGSMFPFDRLIRAADAWAQDNPADDILAQIGDGRYEPRHMRWVNWLDQDSYAGTVRQAELIVAHAGMGSVIIAGQLGKPIVLLPRLKGRHEHNTDHQMATANWLKGKPGVFVAESEAALAGRIEMARQARPGAIPSVASVAPLAFLARLRHYLLS